MNLKNILAASAATLLLASCSYTGPLAPSDTKFYKTDNDKLPVQTGAVDVNGVDIPFTEARNYFVNNTVTGMPPTKITKESDFQKYFGMATTMGTDGQPTAIDFSRQYVVDVVLPETNKWTDIVPLSLKQTADGNLVFTYSIKQGEERSYTIRPFTMIIVDKTYKGKILLNPHIEN